MKADAPGERRALSPEASHFLVQFSIALHKIVTYPTGHPSLELAIRSVTLRLEQLLSERQSVGIGVARDRLVIEGGTTDPSNAVLRGLAEALHRHQVGALQLKRGVSPAEVSSLLSALAVDTRQNPPLGAQEDALSRWPNIMVMQVALDDLELAQGDGQLSRVEQLWLALAAATLRKGPEDVVQERVGSAELAHAIRSNAGDASYDQVIADYMLRVGRELADRNASGSPVAQQLGDMLSAVGEDAIRSLLELGSDLPSRRQLVLDMLRVLPARSVVTLTHAAADASKEVISHALLRLFSKLAANADSHAGNASAASDSVLRDAIQQLVSGWTLDDPNPERYRHLLRFLTSSARVSDATTSVDRWVDSLRVVDIALEAGAIGPSVSRSVDELLEYGRLEELIESIDLAPSSEVAAKIREQIITPDRVKAIFSTQQSRHALDRVLEWTGIEAAEVMLDALEVADSRAMRRQLIARLTSLEGDIGPLVSERLERGPWYVQRNMLYLLSEIGRIPADFLPQVWLEHPDVRVRREAIKVALRVQGWRTQAITVGLADDDTRILNLVVGAAIEHSHASLAHPLIRMLEGPATDTGLRSLAIRALALTHSVDARDWLISRVFSRLRWWRRPALAVKSPEMLAALCALRDQWATTPRAAHALRIALRAPDAEIRAVALTGTLDT